MESSVTIIGNTRITLKRTRPNPLFQEWLEELHSDAKTKKSKLENMLAEALSSISKYPLPLKSGAECAILKGFHKKLCLFLDKRLEVYNILQSQKETTPPERNRPSTSSSIVNTLSEPDNLTNETGSKTSNENIQSSQMSASSSTTSDNSRKKSPRIYKPAYRSGGYAILIALLEISRETSDNPLISKEDLIEKAQKHSEESFVRSKPESFYNAWSNMTRLIAKGLVNQVRKKTMKYSLTETGKKLAIELLRESENRSSVNDIIFIDAPQESVAIPATNVVEQTSVDKNPESASSQSSEATEIVELPAGSFDIILLVDKCETGGLTKKNEPMIAQINKFPDMLHEYRSLKVGDFTWVARDKIDKSKEIVLPYIVERKRMDDLGGSIKDGRFHEQKFRLRKCKLDNVIYLVENYGSNKYVGLPLQTLMQALANTRVVDGFMVHVTDSLTHTVRFLAMMTKRLNIEFKAKNLKASNREPQNGMLMTFDYFNKSSAKNKPLTVNDTFIKLLLQLKGVSIEKAISITNEYPTPASLIKAYENRNQKEGMLLLANLKPVGPKISKAVYHLFTSLGNK